jgi:CheY-like chemotaxis protein
MARILIVDDNCDSGEGLAKVFRTAGHEVTCVPNGREALAHVLHQTPDVVLLDLVMPDMDGPSFLQVVRLYLRMHSLPVVVLTGFTESPMIERVLHLKVSSVLVKGRASPAEILKGLEAAIIPSHHPM